MIKLGLALVVLASATSSLRAEVLDCTYKTNDSSFITERYFFGYDAGDPVAEVLDALIKDKLGKPIAAKLEVKADQKLVFTWKVKVQDRGGMVANMNYRNTINPKDMTAKMTAVASGAPGDMITFNAVGKCVVDPPLKSKGKKSKGKK